MNSREPTVKHETSATSVYGDHVSPRAMNVPASREQGVAGDGVVGASTTSSSTGPQRPSRARTRTRARAEGTYSASLDGATILQPTSPVVAVLAGRQRSGAATRRCCSPALSGYDGHWRTGWPSRS